MSKLVIVESVSKAKVIKNFLGDGYEVMASVGHVRDLPASKLSVDVHNNFAPRYEIVKGKEKLVAELKSAVKKSDGVLLATDPDREGEAISWHLATLLDLDLSQKNRVTFNEITRTGITNGMASPRQVDIDMVNAQQARRILDRLVGYKLSPFVSQKIRRGLSAGRVQSVAVRLIVDKEDEINKFVPEEYWSLDARFTSSSRKVFSAAFAGDETGKVKLVSEEQTNSYISRLDGATYTVGSVKKGTRKKSPAPPFTTSTMQQEASRRLNFQSQRTMKIAQELYEGVNIKGHGSMGLITYMRTDSLRISEQAREQGAEYIKAAYGEKFLPEKPRYFKQRANAQDGHEAVRPTNPALTPAMVKDSLTTEQYKLYNLIWLRFMASLMADCVQNTVKAEIKAQKPGDEQYCTFTATGYEVKFEGFTALYEEATEEDEEKDGKLPELKSGEVLKLKELVPARHFTQAPPRYTEASLIKALEENGVGRPSTYATIITTIIKREYVKRSSKQLVPTELGVATTRLLGERFPKIVNVKFTAQMETSLDDVEEGNADYIAVLHDFYGDFEKTLDKAKAEMQGVKIELEEDKTDIPCDKCGAMMVVKIGRFGKFLACPNYPTCKNAKPLIQETNALCPKCGAKVVEKRSRKGHVFYGCESWPKCDFVTWDKPTGENCPQCGKSLFKQRGGVVSCLNEGCGFEKKVSRKKGKEDE
ncbi:MAG: type I DNA topoisomerase [Clostridia bacterium]|nr:type I DNA topoisomerase [Clostridia bacterium]